MQAIIHLEGIRKSYYHGQTGAGGIKRCVT